MQHSGSATGANVEVGAVLNDEFLEIIPVGFGRVKRRKEEASAAEIIGDNEMDRGAGELADSAGVERGRTLRMVKLRGKGALRPVLFAEREESGKERETKKNKKKKEKRDLEEEG
ncbi:hypothetical protein K1719_011151 [Acacia pycnantha]|nr:hypothetical protein K1719_011151 [Acacia pycnantha]